MKQKLLLVDDRPENLFVLESTLEDPNLEFVKAGSGDEALKQLLHNDISIILLDVQMPGIDGFETAELIRGNPITRNIPIIFVSAISQEKKHIFKGYASGAIDYIFKPFDPEILRSKVNILLEIDKQRRIVENKNDQLSYAKRNTDSILQNVKEGLFLLDRDYRILPQYSRALENIFNLNDLAGKSLLEILKNSISPEIYSDYCEFVKLCFDITIDSSSIADLNPISEVEFRIKGDDPRIKYLFFECRRIYNGNEIENLIFTVNDKTEKVLLENKLAKIEQESNKQMDNLFSIIHVDPMLLRDFIESLQNDINESYSLLGEVLNTKYKKDLLENVFRRMHQIKGNAAVLDLKNFMEQAHAAEDIINELITIENPKEANIKPLYQCLETLQIRIEEIKILISKLNHIYKYFRPKRSYETDLLFKAINNLMDNLQKTTGTKVKLQADNFDSTKIPYNSSLNLKDILVQLIRNSFYHGIENPEDRKKQKKDPVGTITIETIENNDTIDFLYKDDGRGIHLEKLRAAALASGRWDKSEINQWNDNQLMESIYNSGVSTMSKVSTGAGRGVGMDVVKDMVDKCGGQIEIKSETGKYILFKISFPLKSDNTPVVMETSLN